MKDAVYKLSVSKDGVKELMLHAPTRKQLKFAAFVKSSFMATAMEMAETMKDVKTPDKKDTVLSGTDMLAALYAGKTDVGELIDRFLTVCTDSTMCEMNGGPVPEAFLNDLSVEDAEGLFAKFLGNFITI